MISSRLTAMNSWSTSTLDSPDGTAGAEPLMCETAHALKKRVPHCIARITRGAHTDGVNKNPESLSKMKAGDVLVSHPTAVREHEISVIPTRRAPDK
jgi:hypothetical protein